MTDLQLGDISNDEEINAEKRSKKLIGYLVNLDCSPERLYQFNQHKDSCLFKRIPAVDGRLIALLNDPSYVFNMDKARKHCGRELTLGEIGCTLSHLACYKAISECSEINNDEFVIIAEDDIVLDEDFSSNLNMMIDTFNSEKEFELIILSSLFINFTKREGWTLYTNHFERLTFTGTALYLIRKSAAIRITDKVKAEKPYWLADDFTTNFYKGSIGILYPFLGISPTPNESNSLLEKERRAAQLR